MGYGMDDEDWGSAMAEDDFGRDEAFEIKRISPVKTPIKDRQPTRGSKVTCKCKFCKEDFQARVADRKRGWAKFCSKSCKAKQQSKLSQQ